LTINGNNADTAIGTSGLETTGVMDEGAIINAGKGTLNISGTSINGFGVFLGDLGGTANQALVTNGGGTTRVYGVTTGTSIGRLFIAGIVPGVMTCIALLIVVAITSKRHNYPREERVTFKEGAIAVIKGIPAMFTVVIIIGGIRGGFFTPTEGAGMAVAYSFLLGVFYYKEIKIRQIPKIIVEVAITTGQVALMIATASALGWLFARQNIPVVISQFLLGITSEKVFLLLIINVMILFVGLFLDLSPAVIIFAPILLPIAVSLGIDPVHFGVIMVVNLAIGLCTPPAGVCLFIACGIARASLTSVLRGFIGPLLSMVVVLMLITYIPQLVMYLLNLLMK
jgi:C4-dicarboxylate transporter DctM subunit